MTKILLSAAVAYAIVALAAILIDDGVTDARPRPTDTTIIVTANLIEAVATDARLGVGDTTLGDVPEEPVEDALEVRVARTGAHIGRAIEWNPA